MLPKKNPTAHGNGLSSDSASATATTLPDYGFFYASNEVGTVLAPILYGVIADVFSLSVAMVVMGLPTGAILPASLTLRPH